MNTILAFVATLALCYGVNAKGCGDIDAIGSYSQYTNAIVEDIYTGQLAQFDVQNLTSVIIISETNYINVELKNKKLIFSTSDAFKTLEEYERSNNYYNPSVQTEIEVTCPEGADTLTFKQPINDTNNHTPFFNRGTYTYKFGMDIGIGFELTELMQIFATDIDFSTTKIEFSMEPKDILSIQYNSVDNLLFKTHSATVKTLVDISLPSTLEFKLNATDIRGTYSNYKDNKSGFAILKLILVKE